jgi:hypothetical protein
LEAFKDKIEAKIEKYELNMLNQIIVKESNLGDFGEPSSIKKLEVEPKAEAEAPIPKGFHFAA